MTNEKNTNDPLGIIGKKMKGFKFESGEYNSMSYDNEMDECVGVVGDIFFYKEESNCYECKYSNGVTWYYPAELIMQHIVEEPKELTLLEKFEQGWEIRHNKSEIKAVQVIKRKEGVGYIIEWEKGGVFSYIGNESYITCTPPKERKTLYVYEGRDGLFTILSPIDNKELITEIHLEKTDGKWNVIK